MFIYKLRHDKRGMTLIEMIISLVILSILMTSTLGMITSSMSIFTSTSMAAIDRMVGNSVYQTLESALKYSTHLTIRETADTTRTSQSFYVSVTDQDTNSGNLMYRAEGDEYLSLYTADFYGNRSIQYSIEEVGSDHRHVKITVKIFREGEVVYTKDAVIKCINLALVQTAADDNSIDNQIPEENRDTSVNQYLYFSVDEMLISGGSDAWALEYKVNDYMRGYNAILSEYYGKLNAAENQITDAVKKYTGGNSIGKTEFNALVSTRDKAIFGDGTTNYAWEGTDPAQYNNLWAHYKEVMKEYLGFVPDDAGLDINSNPYAGVVATNEELYLGFMLEYYDDNGDGSISKEEYPTFTDPNTFFNGTVFSDYIDDDNKMAIMTYFDDGLNDNYRSLFTAGTGRINVFDDTAENTHVGAEKGAEQWVTTLNEYFELGGYYFLSNDLSVMSTTIKSKDQYGVPLYYSYNGDGSDTALGTFEVATYQKDTSYKSYANTIADIKARMNKSNVIEGTDNSGMNSYPQVNLHDLSDGYTTVKSINRDFQYNSKSYTEIILKVQLGILEDYWYYTETVNGVEYFHIIYLEAAYNAKKSENRPEQVVTIYGDADAATGAPEHVIMMYVDNSTGTLYGYNYVRDGWSIIVDSATPTTVKTYTFNNHQYKDWIMYGVDWLSWFEPVNGGLLDKLIGNIASWFTGQGSITSISASNSEDALGLQSQYNASTLNSDIRSYNTAWIVYNPRRSTWYYIPDSSNRLSSAISGISWTSFQNAPVPLDIEDWGNSTKMINDIESRKLSSSGLFGLIDTTSDYIWVPLPNGNKVNANQAATLG